MASNICIYVYVQCTAYESMLALKFVMNGEKIGGVKVKIYLLVIT